MLIVAFDLRWLNLAMGVTMAAALVALVIGAVVFLGKDDKPAASVAAPVAAAHAAASAQVEALIRDADQAFAAQRFAGDDASTWTILKLLGSESVQRAALLSVEVAGAPVFDERLDSLGATIYGGTSEVQRNIIAERGLGLPRGKR